MSLIPPSHREGIRNNADSYEKLDQRLRLRQDTPAGWLKNDPVLESGEFGYEVGYPSGKLKIGTGSTRWSELPYLLSRGPAGQPGATGPAGPPGKGIQIKGVADVWPPPGTPEVGDLWILDDPIPAMAPAGSVPGDGFSWTGTKWVATGPIQGPEGKPGKDGLNGTNGIDGKDGADGKDGVDGQSVSVFQSAATPSPTQPGDMWLQPGAASGETILNIWDGNDWVAVATNGSGGGPPVDLTGYIKQGDDATLGNLTVEGDILAPYGFLYTNNLTVGGEFYYGGGTLKAGQDPKAATGYRLPTPTGDGFLRSDADINTGWYFAEPVIVSDTTPPAPTGGSAIWVDPTGDAAGASEFTADNPIKITEDPILAQQDGTPIGLSADGMTFHQPLITGAIPVVIGGKKYLIPVCDA